MPTLGQTTEFEKEITCMYSLFLEHEASKMCSCKENSASLYAVQIASPGMSMYRCSTCLVALCALWSFSVLKYCWLITKICASWEVLRLPRPGHGREGGMLYGRTTQYSTSSSTDPKLEVIHAGLAFLGGSTSRGPSQVPSILSRRYFHYKASTNFEYTLTRTEAMCCCY